MDLYCAVIYIHHSVSSSFAQNHCIIRNLLWALEIELSDIWLFLVMHLHNKSAIRINNPAYDVSV